VLVHRSTRVSRDDIYQLFFRPFGVSVPAHLMLIMLIVVPLFVAVAVLLVARLPDGDASRPAVRTALALGVAWLLVWPFQFPWYDAIAMCLLALYPPSRLDWPVLARQVAGTLFYMPGMAIGMDTGWPGVFTQAQHHALVPIIRLAALAAVVALAITGAWHAQTGPPAGQPSAQMADAQ
jgi:hypothetical protein